MAHSDVRVVAAGGIEKYADSGATDADRGSKLLTAVGLLSSGDHLILGPGVFDVGTQPVEPQSNNVVISGSGLGTVIFGQPSGINPLFRPVGDDMELRDLYLLASGGSGVAFGSTTSKPRGDHFTARALRLYGIGATVNTVSGNTSRRVSRWWDCEVLREGDHSNPIAAVFGPHDRADFFNCRFYCKTFTNNAVAIQSTSTDQVQRFYNCDVVAESASGAVSVAQSSPGGDRLELYGGRLVGTPPGNPANTTGKFIRLFGAMTNLPDGEGVIHYDSNVPRWRVVELVPADFVPISGFFVGLGATKEFPLKDGELVLATLIVPVQQFQGGGITDYKVSVGRLGSIEQPPTTNLPELYANQTDVDVAPGDTVFHLEDRRVLTTLGNTTARVFATSSGANPNQATAGKVRVHLLSVRPWPYVRDAINPIP